MTRHSRDEDSELVDKGHPCSECGSSDAVASYTDGHRYCFSCTHYYPPEDNAVAEAKPKKKDTRPFAVQLAELLEGSEIKALTKWGITQATARALDYRVKLLSDNKAYHIATYKDETGKPVFAKVRIVTPDNTKAGFFGIGDESKVSLWGIETLGKGGKMVIVTEGEKDRLAASQLWGNKFPVGSIPFGAESSGEAFARALAKLSKFDKVVLALDMDRQGQAGTLDLARMLPPGKVHIAQLTRKDIAEMVEMDGPDKTISALHNAQPYRPDGIVTASSLWGQALAPVVRGLSFPFAFMDKWTYGKRPGEVIIIGAGIGIGKSDFQAECAAHDIKPKAEGGNGVKAAIFNYEAGPVSTLKGIAGKLRNRRFHIPDEENLYWSPEQLTEARVYMENTAAPLFINDHFGAVDWDSVKERIRYLRHAEGVTQFYIDPVAALVADEEDERKALDKLFAESKQLAEELQINIIFNSHLTRPMTGPSHEEGGQVSMRHFRGSGGITLWASFVFGMERNQQSEDEEERAYATIRVIKDRFTGDSTGKTARIVYNRMNGRYEIPVLKLDEVAPPPVTQEEDPE